MDNTILPKTAAFKNKPPILPKPKVIPERPCFRPVRRQLFPSDVTRVQVESSETKYDGDFSDASDVDSSSCVSTPNAYSEGLVVSTCPQVVSISSYIAERSEEQNTVRTADGNSSDTFVCVSEDSSSVTSTDPRWPEELPDSDNGEKSDSLTYLDCPQENTTFDSTFETNNDSLDQYNGFATDSISFKSKEKSAFLIAQEFMTSEQAYVQALRLIVVDFKEHLDSYADHCPVISNAEFDKIVSPLPQLLKLNEDLLSDLEQRIKLWSVSPKLADVIVKKGPFLKLYSTYMKNYIDQCSILEEYCLRHQKFSQARYDFENLDLCKKLTLPQYMLKAVQRIPQYRLLLERYLSELEDGSEEHANAKSALTIVENVLTHANSTIQSSNNLSKLLKLQGRLGNYEIIKPSRSLIKEGELQKLSRKEIQPRFFILLSDCLLYTTYSTSTSYLRMKYELPLAGMRVQRHEGTEFDIITSKRSFTLRSRNEEECADWITSLQAAIGENNQRQQSFLAMQSMTRSVNSDSLKMGKEAPVWIQDRSTTMCQICTEEFTVTYRRHHCRCCGRVVCKECSSYKAPLEYLKFNSVRVCEECFDFLLKEFEDPNNIGYIQRKLRLTEDETASTHQKLKSSFKRYDSTRKSKKVVPQRLMEVTARDTGSQINGWLEIKGKRAWKRLWFVLKGLVLYSYKASKDVRAHKTLAVLGYTVDQPQESVDDIDKNVLFRLTHHGRPTLLFHAPTEQSTKMWVEALDHASVLTS